MVLKHIKKTTVLLILVIFFASFLRLWRLDQVPVSLFGDELDVGYQAYSILRTGRDYSGNFLPIHFQSLAEWRTPLYLYSSIPTVAIFGISPWGVRLPAAIFGIVSIWAIFLLVSMLTKNRKLGLISALLLAISPWHIQYSRAGFEVTEMILFYLLGIYFFLRGLKNGKLLSLSMVFLALTPWVYSTAKLFLPLTLITLFFIYRQGIFKISRKYLLFAFASLIIVGGPIAWSTVYGGGADRFGYISVFTDPTTIPEVGVDRLNDSKVLHPGNTVGLSPTLEQRLIHNKFTWWKDVIVRNYFQAFSTQFLFITGDLNPRHSVHLVGELYKIEAIFLLLGLFYLFTKPYDKRLRILVVTLILLAPAPSAITRDGGMHATRLIFLLPFLLFLISIGIYHSYHLLKKRYKPVFATVVVIGYLLSFYLYQHNYWFHYPWYSERWWHSGFEGAIKTAVSKSGDYDKVIISMADEPAFIFFLGWSQYPPDEVQKGLFSVKENIPHFGDITKLGKYYFGSPGDISGVYQLASVLPPKTLYIASAKEVNVNLILEPNRTPQDLILVRAIPFPSGEPAFYLFAKK